MQVLRSARRGVRSSDSARASWQRGVWRKPIAKHWPDEQKADSRLIEWVRGLKDSKPKYTYGAESVDLTGISVKAVRHTRGGPSECRKATDIARWRVALMEVSRTAAVATLLIEILRRIARYRWSFSRLLKFVRLNLLTYKKLDVWINRPDFRIQKQSPPKTQRQMELNFDWKWSWGPTFKGLFGKAHVYWEEAFPTSLCTFLIRTAVLIYKDFWHELGNIFI